MIPMTPYLAPVVFQPSGSSLPPIDKPEVLRYLGYGGTAPNPATDALVDRCIDELTKEVRPRAVYAAFPLVKSSAFSEEPGALTLDGCSLALPGEDIAAHLAGCHTAVLLCATLSMQADALIRRRQVQDVTAGLVMDCCATTLVEQLCDEVERQVKPLFGEEGRPAGFTTRFSPGYGDLPLSIQAAFLAALDAPRKIGLCVTDSDILTPRKSVTAVFGVTDAAPSDPRTGCARCSLRGNCAFRRKGEFCGLSHTAE